MRRPIPKWTRYLHKEVPSFKDRRRLIYLYKKGGRPFEPDIRKEMGAAETKQGRTWDRKTGQELWWLYIGEYWWCRKRGRKYEFARMYALTYEDGIRTYDGLWNEARHAPDEYPRIVFKDGKKGYIVEYSRFEIWVQWENEHLKRESQVSHSSLDGITFEYEEDEKYFKNLLRR